LYVGRTRRWKALAKFRVVFESPQSRTAFIEQTKARDDVERPGLET
jgi:hypothetical protein